MTVFLFIALMLIIGVFVTVGLVSPKETMVISSEIIIDRPRDMVWNYIRLLRNQEQYNKWIRQNPNIKMEYSGTDGTPGFIAAWQSRGRMGKGEQVILSVNEGESFDTELRFRNHSNTTHIRTSVEATEGSKTKVRYVMTATPAFPMSMMVPMMKKMLKKDSDESLAKLKEVLEA